MTGYILPPKGGLPGFPQARKARPKTVFDGGSKRRRWRDDKRIFEWDYQHGHVEMYDRRGHHLGAYDAYTGKQLKNADPSKSVEP